MGVIRDHHCSVPLLFVLPSPSAKDEGKKDGKDGKKEEEKKGGGTEGGQRRIGLAYYTVGSNQNNKTMFTPIPFSISVHITTATHTTLLSRVCGNTTAPSTV